MLQETPPVHHHHGVHLFRQELVPLLIQYTVVQMCLNMARVNPTPKAEHLYALKGSTNNGCCYALTSRGGNKKDRSALRYII